MQIFVTRGGNKKYASVLAPGQLDGLKYDFLLYSFLIGTIILFSVFMQVTCNLIVAGFLGYPQPGGGAHPPIPRGGELGDRLGDWADLALRQAHKNTMI